MERGGEMLVRWALETGEGLGKFFTQNTMTHTTKINLCMHWAELTRS
jgi:hypothetical protein